jgi:hypothetical protein
MSNEEMEKLRRQFDEMRLKLQEAEKRAEEAEERADDAEWSFAPVAFPVALARVHDIKDCSSTATKPHVHKYESAPQTRIVNHFGGDSIQWRLRGNSGRRLTSLFNTAMGPDTTHSARNEASLATSVDLIIKDCVLALGLNDRVAINPEVTSLQIRADLWVIYAPDNRPIGTVEVKQHGPLSDVDGLRYSSAVEHPGVLAQVHDQLSHLRHVWGVKQAFGIVTTLRTWRVCWLDDDDTNDLAQTPNRDLQKYVDHRSERKLGPDAYSTPQGADGRTNSASPPRTPVAAPTDLKNVVVLARSEQPSEGGDDDDDDGPPNTVQSAPAKLAMSEALEVRKPPEGAAESKDLADPRVMSLVGAALLRMYRSDLLFDLEDPFKNADERNFTVVERDSTYWGKLTLAAGCPVMGSFPQTNTKRLWLVGRVGKGRDGIAHLACTHGARAVCVIKERCPRRDRAPISTRDAKELLKKECAYWQRVYGTEFPTRVAQWNGSWTLMTPFFSHVAIPLRKHDKVTDAVKDVLQKFADAGVRHGDVAWRNICIYQTAGCELRAVLIDLVDVSDFGPSHDRNAWVKESFEKLMATT